MKNEEKHPAAGATVAPDAAADEDALELTEDELEDVTGGLGAWHADLAARLEEVPLWRGW